MDREESEKRVCGPKTRILLMRQLITRLPSSQSVLLSSDSGPKNSLPPPPLVPCTRKKNRT